MTEHNSINYVELPARDLEEAKSFYSSVFGWEFEDFGPAYTAIMNAGLGGGFYEADLTSVSSEGAALVVIYSKTLNETLQKVEEAGGKIVKAPFTFPGGCRFHFTDPNGNELAVWTMAEE